jgi:hypothetical protein
MTSHLVKVRTAYLIQSRLPGPQSILCRRLLSTTTSSSPAPSEAIVDPHGSIT